MGKQRPLVAQTRPASEPQRPFCFQCFCFLARLKCESATVLELPSKVRYSCSAWGWAAVGGKDWEPPTIKIKLRWGRCEVRRQTPKVPVPDCPEQLVLPFPGPSFSCLSSPPDTLVLPFLALSSNLKKERNKRRGQSVGKGSSKFKSFKIPFRAFRRP